MLSNMWCCGLGVDNLDKLGMIMKIWLTNAIIDCQWEGYSIDEFFIKEMGIIDDNDIMLDVVDYFNVDKYKCQ
jgi:hypothetical protein